MIKEVIGNIWIDCEEVHIRLENGEDVYLNKEFEKIKNKKVKITIELQEV